MSNQFAEQIRIYIQRRNLPIEQLATLANLSRKTLYRWVNGEVIHPRYWYEVVSLGKALRLNVDEMDRLLWLTKNPGLSELKELTRYEYEQEILEEFVSQELVSGPIPRPPIRFESWPSLEAPTGAMRPESPFYVERVADTQLVHQLEGEGTTTTIQASRQTGKTSLLMHAIHNSRSVGKKVIYLDFQLMDETSHDNLTSFLRLLSESIAEQLELEWEVVDQYWQTARNPAQTFNRFMQREVLQKYNQEIILALDEADVLLDTAYRKHFFALLRAWDARRAFDPIWRKLNLVMVISTHPYLLIDDVNLSPFNVGLTLQLQDFTHAQVAELNQRHANPLKPNELPDLMMLVGGHPYLVRQAFYTMISEELSLLKLQTIATSPEGPFGKHLRFYEHSLKKNPALMTALQQVLRGQGSPDMLLLERLSAVGLIQRHDEKWKARCGLYEQFFIRNEL